jgi:hypothetical protein
LVAQVSYNINLAKNKFELRQEFQQIASKPDVGAKIVQLEELNKRVMKALLEPE